MSADPRMREAIMEVVAAAFGACSNTTADAILAVVAHEQEDLLHAMHDAAKCAEGATKAILEGVLHAREYGGRSGPHGGDKCR